MTTLPAPSVLVALTSAVALAASTSATAQNALGGGHALDANPQVGSGGRNMPGVVEDFRARNRIVTGEVAGGREFRGDVGYVGERAFSSVLPTDEFFRFQSGAAASAIDNILTGVSADRFNLATSGGVFAFDRDFTAPPAGQSAFVGRAAVVPERFELDAISRASSTARLLERSSASPISAPVLFDGQPVAAIAGPVTGLRFEMVGDGFRMPRQDLPMVDMSMLADEIRREVPGAIVPGAAFMSPLADRERRVPAARSELAIDGRIGPEIDARREAMVGDRTELSLRDTLFAPGATERITADPDYDAIVRRIVEQYGTATNVTFTGEPGIVDALRREIDALRDQLERPADPTADPLGIPSIRDRLLAEEAARPEDAPPPDPQRVVISDELAEALRHGQTVEELSPSDRTRLADIMSRGEGLLAQGQYMQAEGQFDRALRIVPRHPKALAGLVSSQIGAGLYLSAAVNLHQLLAAHPEMIDVRYGRRILPSEGRIEVAINALRNRIRTAGPAEKSDFGLLLAFIGHQLDDRDRVLEGLDAMREATPDSALLVVLDAVWVGE